MSATASVLSKLAAEVRLYVFDFSNRRELQAGETLSSPAVPAVTGLAVGAPAVTTRASDGVPAGQGVAVTLSGGTAGVAYAVRCTVQTSGGATLECDGTLQVN